MSREGACLHCGLPLPGGDDAAVRAGFCCRGCRAVHALLAGQGLTRFYDLRGRLGQPAQLPDADAPRDWLAPLQATAQTGGRLGLDMQGLHCAGCVWVIDELFRRRAKEAGGAGSAEISPALGRAELLVPSGFDLAGFVSDVESLGYRLGPATGDGRSASDGLLLRTGICLALAGNGMFYAAAIYFGLEEGPIRLLLDRMSYGAALLAVAVGGPVFFRAAWSGLRRGVLHLDVPIAVGILLAFAGASWSFFFGAGRAAYLDTVTVFVALMLLGRWTQERVLERNRRQLLEDGGAGSLRARRVEGPPGQERLRLVRADAIRAGDVLYLARGDLVPVDGHLLAGEGMGDAAAFSTDWIDGEAEPRVYAQGELVPAGAFQVGRLAQRIEAVTDFADSAVVRLLRAPKVAADAHAWWHRVASIWVLGVLFAAGLGFALAWDPAHPEAALDVATAVLVVTCPCAFGIATPLAYELAMARLRRRGLFVRTRAFLDRVRDLDRIVFDKTGTLTTGRLRLADAAPLRALAEAERATLATLAGATSHPKS
ncbi:MAG: heavy metal translocating P-type ATPase metal-binding domain-containing protein, partial [Myxococcota bacterium]